MSLFYFQFWRIVFLLWPSLFLMRSRSLIMLFSGTWWVVFLLLLSRFIDKFIPCLFTHPPTLAFNSVTIYVGVDHFVFILLWICWVYICRLLWFGKFTAIISSNTFSVPWIPLSIESCHYTAVEIIDFITLVAGALFLFFWLFFPVF